MLKGRALETMPIQALIDPSEWVTLHEKTQEIAADYPDITGVIAIGSLIQCPRPPARYLEQRRPGELGAAYDSVRNAGRRKLFPGQNSDLDIWVALNDTPQSAAAETAVSRAGIGLIEALANGTVERGTQQWHYKKRSAFTGNYKNTDFYTSRFTEANSSDAPWMAADFKQRLEASIVANIPDFVDRVNRFTTKKIPGDFLEVRAYPESVYNLRPDQVMMDGGILDREPFPQIGDDQWISPQDLSTILYAGDKSEIYPFVSDGRMVGQEMHDHIMARVSRDMGTHAIGALLLKPDAIETKQVSIIRNIVKEKIARIGGQIVFERLLPGLSYEQVVGIYPALSGEDLEDAAVYLGSGPNLGMVIKAPMDEASIMREINAVKGPRVGNRSPERLMQGRIENATIRDLLPIPSDEDRYRALVPTLLDRQLNPDLRFTKEQYAYYSRNLAHSPDNSLELDGLLRVIGYDK